MYLQKPRVFADAPHKLLVGHLQRVDDAFEALHPLGPRPGGRV